MISGALDKIYRLRPKMLFAMQIRVIFALPSPLWRPLHWCPGQLPKSLTPRSTTVFICAQKLTKSQLNLAYGTTNGK